jgi:hypothetical protein
MYRPVCGSLKFETNFVAAFLTRREVVSLKKQNRVRVLVSSVKYAIHARPCHELARPTL